MRPASRFPFAFVFALGGMIQSVQALEENLSIKSSSFSFFTIGDWGAGTTNQSIVAQTMGTYGASYLPAFVIALGDNIYNQGVQSPTDPLWDTRYKEIYTDPALYCPWYAILGNHDYYGGHPEAEITFYTQHMDDRWIMPDFYYSRIFDVEQEGYTVQVLFLDTVALASESFQRMLDEDQRSGEVARGVAGEGYVRGRGLRTLEEKGIGQLAWIEETLSTSMADWLLVVGHFPVYSASHHGDTAELISKLKPLLEKYEVDAYLCGHDHTLQYLIDAPEGFAPAYFVSGSGGQDVYDLHDTPQRNFAVSEAGFMVHELLEGGKSMKVSIIGRDGDVIFTKTLKQKRKGQAAAIAK